jgi:acetyl-CoA carboxylase carboxyltransferase component
MASMEEKIAQLKIRQSKVLLGGGPQRIAKQHASGKLTARERLEKLLDPGTFVELDQFVRHRCVDFGMEKEETPGEGVITGYGTIDGRMTCVFAQDFTVMGGSLGGMHAEKIMKVQDYALKMGAPLIGLNDSGGARIQETIDALSGYCRIFFRNTMASGVIPQISAIMGPCAGGAVYSPALTDFTYLVKSTSQMFITGPQVIKAVTGEEVSAEKLGGALTHSTVSGVASFTAENDFDCLQQIRYLLSFLPSNNMEDAPEVNSGDDPNRKDPCLNTVMPNDSNQTYDMTEIIKMIVDNGEFYEVRPLYACNIITCFARFDGKSVGIVANQPKVMAGCLDINAADKASRFIRFCDAFNIPLVNLVDVPGFLPGVDQEYDGIIRHGAKMLYAYSEASVPKITLFIRKAYGGSYAAMCSQEMGADLALAWPSAEIAVMGPAGAASIIFRGDPDVDVKTAQYVEDFSTPYKAAERGVVDQVIEPAETRPRIITALAMLASKREKRMAKKHGNIPL